jgi:hypothetical protein
MRASLMESCIAAMTLGVFSIGSPRKRIAAVSVAATRSAPLRRSSVLGTSEGRQGSENLRCCFQPVFQLAALGVSALLVKSVCMKSNFSLDQVEHEPVVEPVVFRRTRVPHF